MMANFRVKPNDLQLILSLHTKHCDDIGFNSSDVVAIHRIHSEREEGTNFDEQIFVITKKGEVFARGSNLYGVLATDDTNPIEGTMKRISHLSNLGIVQLESGYYHVLALT